MNSEKRAVLKNSILLLEKAIASVERVCDQEQDAVDNYPENLQGTDTYEAMEDAVDGLSEAIEKLEDAKALIEGAAL